MEIATIVHSSQDPTDVSSRRFAIMKTLVLLGIIYQVTLILASPSVSPQNDESNDLSAGRRVFGGTNNYYYDKIFFVVKLELRYMTRNGMTTWNCTGTALSNRAVLTSSSCVNRTGRLPTLISLHFPNSNVKPMLIYPREIHTYPNQPSEGENSTGSLVILKIGPSRKPMTGYYSNGNMDYPTLPTTAENDEIMAAVVLGWGQINSQGHYSNYVQKAEVHTSENELCQMFYDFTITDNNTCVLENNQGTCVGDEGGPLLILNRGGSYTIFGVNTINPSQCSDFVPSVYIKVQPYLSWIRSYVN